MPTQTEQIIALAESIAADIKLLANNKVDQVAGKGLSTNDYSTAEKTKLDVLVPVWHAGLRSGRYYGGATGTIGNTPIVADTIYWAPVLVPVHTTIVEIGCNVVATGTATLARLGLYRLAAGVLTAVALPAEFAVTSTGSKPQTVSAAVEPGMYFLGVVANGTLSISVAQLNGAAGPASLCGYLHGGSTAVEGGNANVGLTTSHAFGALPSPTLALSSTVYGGIIIPHLTYRV